MGFLDFLSRKSTGQDSPIVRKICEIIRPKFGSDYTDKNAVSKYRGWVYTAANHNARNIADGELHLYSNVAPRASIGRQVGKSTKKLLTNYGMKAMDDVVEIPSHPIIDLLQNPNPRDTFYDLIYKTDLFLELVGDAYWWVKRDGNGIPIELHVLYSQFVNIQHDGQNKIIKYNYGIAVDGEWQYNFDPEDIIHFKFFDPNDLFHGISPLHACARSHGLIEAMDTYEEALNRNLGIPSGILKYVNQKLKPEDRQMVEKRWQQKFSSVGRANKVVVTDQDMSYEPIGIEPRHMQFLDGRKWSREEILACYGVNPALLLTEHANYSNMVQASINYHHNTLHPRFKLISQTITNRLVRPNGLNGRDLIVTIEKSAPEDAEMVIKKAELLSKHEALRVNELRKMLGQEVLDEVYGDSIVTNRSVRNGQEQNQNQ